MEIGFYLQNSGIKDVDCRFPLEGNPGIGGTEYLFISIPYSLHQSDSHHKITLFANSVDYLPPQIDTVCVGDDNEFLRSDKIKKLDCIVLRYSPDNFELAQRLPPRVKVVMWAHNFIKRGELTALANCPNVAGIVCVGSEQLNFYRDHEAYNKSVVIFNGYPVKHFVENLKKEVSSRLDRQNEVTFLGNLVEYKGFHVLAQAWKKVLESVPDAKLNVIGGGKLYDRTQKLGKWGIAEQSYEERFMPYLQDEKGNLLPSVVFHGVMGPEKCEVLNRTKVGVPNPSGVSETFCIAALEMQLWGAQVVTIDYGGFKDTVKWGQLYTTVEDMAAFIVAALKNPNDGYERAVEELMCFDFSEVTKDWLKLFDALESGGNLTGLLKPSARGHRLKELNRQLKRVLPFGRFLPSAMFYRSVANRLKP